MQITINVEGELKKIITDLSAITGMTIAAVVEEMLRNAVDNARGQEKEYCGGEE